MSYKTLEQRFLENASSIYKQFNNTTSLVPEIKPDTKESRSRIKDDSRSLPVVSTVRDTQLLKSFLLSSKGQLFVGKQLLLQTGNTFAETRLFNPISFAGNAIPFLHLVRFRGVPIYNLMTPTRDNRGALQSETITNLQNSTGNILTRFARRVVNTASSFGALVAPPSAKLTTEYGVGYEFYVRPEDSIYNVTIGSTGITGFGNQTNWVLSRLVGNGDKKTRGQKNSIAPYTGTQKDVNANAIQSSIRYASEFSNRLALLTRTNRFYKGNLKSSILTVYTSPSLNSVSTIDTPDVTGETLRNDLSKINYNSSSINADYKIDEKSFYDHLKTYTQTQATNTKPQNLLPYSRLAELSGSTNPYFGGTAINLQNTQGTLPPTPNLSETSNRIKSSLSKLRDPYNTKPNNVTYNTTKDYSSTGPVAVTTDIPTSEVPTDAQSIRPTTLGATITTSVNVLNYKEVLAPKEDTKDIIKFIFKSKDDEPAVFRAFISSFRESVKPEFSEQRYVGRTERFVTYAGVKRNASLEFNVVAFSKDELDIMWMRVNYLTGLAFPRGASASGFMVPPLFKLTVGGIYEDQPCYIDTLDYDFLDDKITFDIDKQVSQVINVKLGITLLEKSTRFYDSPFYQITQNLADTPTS